MPGSIYAPTFRGTNKLIQDGEAKLVTSVEDILEELNLTMVAHQMEMKELVPADETEALLLRHLSAEPIHIDEVRRESRPAHRDRQQHPGDAGAQGDGAPGGPDELRARTGVGRLRLTWSADRNLEESQTARQFISAGGMPACGIMKRRRSQ